MPRCNVPGCNNGSTANLRKVRLAGERPKSLFSVPKCPILSKKWEDALQMKDKTLTSKSKVCEVHFSKIDIIKYDDTILKDGTINRIPRYNYRLCDQAVPTAIYINKNLCVIPKDDSSEEDIQTPPFTTKVYGKCNGNNNDNDNNVDTVIKMEYADIKQDEDMMYQEELMLDNDPLSENNYNFIKLKRDIMNHDLIMPSGWTYIFQHSSVTFVYIHEFAIHVFCIIDNDMSVQIVTFDKRVTTHVDVQFSNTSDILKYLNSLAELECCKGTGIASSYSKYCSGFISSNEKSERYSEYQRCKSCHEFRNLIRQKSLEERTNTRLDDNKQRKMKALDCADTRLAKKTHSEIM